MILRSAGVLWDLRKTMPYERYSETYFNVPVGLLGDCYDRYLIRVQEMRESLRIIYFALNHIWQNFDSNVGARGHPRLLNKLGLKDNMEALIEHFNNTVSPTFGFKENNEKIGEYVGVEAPKGEFGLCASLSRAFKITRLKIRAPGYFHLQGLQSMVTYHLLADVVTIIGTQDLVFGEIDR